MITALVLLLVAHVAPVQGQSCPPEKIEPERIYSGVFVDEFEGQRFFDGANSMADVNRRAVDSVWMDFDLVGMGESFGIRTRSSNQAYRLSFVGVKRTRGARNIPCGYGHLNTFDSDMRVVSLLAIEPIALSSGNPR